MSGRFGYAWMGREHSGLDSRHGHFEASFALHKIANMDYVLFSINGTFALASSKYISLLVTLNSQI
jgi:hypothetical protein